MGENPATAKPPPPLPFVVPSASTPAALPLPLIAPPPAQLSVVPIELPVTLPPNVTASASPSSTLATASADPTTAMMHGQSNGGLGTLTLTASGAHQYQMNAATANGGSHTPHFHPSHHLSYPPLPPPSVSASSSAPQSLASFGMSVESQPDHPHPYYAASTQPLLSGVESPSPRNQSQTVLSPNSKDAPTHVEIFGYDPACPRLLTVGIDQSGSI